MIDSLFSPNWFRVAQLRPQLAAHIRVRRQSARNARWYLFTDSLSGRQHRLNNIAYQFAGRCNGRSTTNQIWETLLETLGDQAPTQTELLDLIATLSASDLLVIDESTHVPATVSQVTERRDRLKRARLNPLQMRFPLFNPSPWLQRLDGLGLALFQTWVMLAWLCLIAWTLLGAMTHWQAVIAYADNHMLTPRYLLLSWLCFPFIKALHELSHALAIRRWGGEVAEMGIAFLITLPAPYVDASAATGFRSRYQRALVSAAGIMTELTLAALAFWLWLASEPGLLHDIAFVTAFLGSVSSLLFNGNPLLRFDGYYLLTDMLDLPNLAARSNLYWRYGLQRYLLRLANAQSPQPAHGEWPWLLCYAPASWLYRLLVGVWISFWLASHSLWIGLLVGCSLLYLTLLKPLLHVLGWVFFSPGHAMHKLHSRLIALSGLFLLAMAFFVLPLPYTTVAQGVVYPPEQAILRAKTDGFIEALLAGDGEKIVENQAVFQLTDPQLQARATELQAELDGLLGEQYQHFLSDPTKAKNRAEAMQGVQAEQSRVAEKQSQLIVRAQAAGWLVIPLPADLPGQFVKQGEMLGYVFSPKQLRVRVVVDEGDIDLIRQNTTSIMVRLADRPDKVLPATLIQETPAATQTLPSPALADRAGGDRMTDPGDKSGVKTLEPVFLLELRLPANAGSRVGTRGWVHFEHSSQAVGKRWLRWLRQLFLKHFSAAG